MGGSRRLIIKDIAIVGILTALVYITTLVHFPWPFSATDGGMVHFGNVPVIIAAIVFDKRKGAFAGAVGMALFDISAGYVIWAPFTFVISGVMGYIFGLVAEKKRGRSVGLNILALACGGLIRLVGYYIAELVLYGNPFAPLLSMPGDAMQIVLAGVLTIPLLGKLCAYKERYLK